MRGVLVFIILWQYRTKSVWHTVFVRYCPMLFYRIDDFSDALYFTFYHVAVLQILRRHEAHTDTAGVPMEMIVPAGIFMAWDSSSMT